MSTITIAQKRTAEREQIVAGPTINYINAQFKCV